MLAVLVICFDGSIKYKRHALELLDIKAGIGIGDW